MIDYRTRKRVMLGSTQCELCGCKRGLDVHHIIPRVAGGSDREDNLIVLCSGCHGKLTPKSELSKIGLSRKTSPYRENLDDALSNFYQDINGQEERLTACEMIDLLNSYVLKPDGAGAVGRKKGAVEGKDFREGKKAKQAKRLIIELSKDFGGNLSDVELIRKIGCARGSFYKYKRALREERGTT